MTEKSFPRKDSRNNPITENPATVKKGQSGGPQYRPQTGGANSGNTGKSQSGGENKSKR